ncbi:MAG: extracellular solute-binding protein [Candidatus Dormibacteria bacterium]
MVIKGLCLAALAGALGAALLGTAPAMASGGIAQVACAGSFQLALDQHLGPAFTAATGDLYQSQAGGSLAIAQEIVAGEIHPNVFIPVGPAPMELLEPRFTSWAVRFASSPLVVAYYPRGAHATELGRIARGKLPIKDLFRLLATPGFRLGRTDPAVDPQGQGFAMMFQLARRELHLSAATVASDLGGADPGGQIFAETSLESTLQAGQLDAASAYLSQAVQLHLPYIPLPSDLNFGNPRDAHLYAWASLRLSTGPTVHGSVLDLEASALKGPGEAAADSFIAFLLRRPGRALLRQEGYQLLSPAVLGKASAVPGLIRKLVRET